MACLRMRVELVTIATEFIASEDVELGLSRAEVEGQFRELQRENDMKHSELREFGRLRSVFEARDHHGDFVLCMPLFEKMHTSRRCQDRFGHLISLHRLTAFFFFPDRS